MDTAAILRADADRPKFDPRKYGKKSIKPLQLSEFEEKNLTANAVVMMMLDMSAGTQKKLKAIQRERQACEAEILSVRSERHKLAVRRMGLRKFKRKKARRGRGVAGSAKLPPILAKALEPPMGPMALQKLAGAGACAPPAPAPVVLQQQRSAAVASSVTRSPGGTGAGKKAKAGNATAQLSDSLVPLASSSWPRSRRVDNAKRAAAFAQALPLPLDVAHRLSVLASARAGEGQTGLNSTV